MRRNIVTTPLNEYYEMFLVIFKNGKRNHIVETREMVSVPLSGILLSGWVLDCRLTILGGKEEVARYIRSYYGPNRIVDKSFSQSKAIVDYYEKQGKKVVVKWMEKVTPVQNHFDYDEWEPWEDYQKRRLTEAEPKSSIGKLSW